MARRLGWDRLKADYRARLERNGITQSDYEAGHSLKAGRGHARTPEHPREANPTQHPTYYRERQSLIHEIDRKKQEYFGNADRWHAQRARDNVRMTAVPIGVLRTVAEYSEEEWLDALRETESPDIRRLLGYR